MSVTTFSLAVARAWPAHCRDVLPALTDAGVVPAEVTRRLEGLAGLRNIIVHDYVQVDAWS